MASIYVTMIKKNNSKGHGRKLPCPKYKYIKNKIGRKCCLD